MSENFDKLKNIGAQKIHENTHISRLHVESILDENFSGMTKIQLLGFISILEREYSLNLETLKNDAIKYFQVFEEERASEDLEVKVFLAPKRKRNLTPIYLTFVLIIFVTIMLMSMSFDTSKEEITTLDNSAIEYAKNNIEPIIDISIEENITEENITNEIQDEKLPEIIEKVESNSFKITPKVKVWLGYVDLQTHKKYQKTFKDEFDLDPSKDWILAFGHGKINIEINGVIKKYKIKKNVRFSYLNGELKEISLEEFKRLNKGARW